jgi:uncharacterized protein YndB with AHSA1/START domain
MTGVLELSLERRIAAPPQIVWKIWTERTAEWWAPKPWTTRIIEMDFRAGGRTAMTMSSPDGKEASPMEGVFLVVAPNRRIVTTDAFTVGWIPQKPFMTAIFAFDPDGDGTRYAASVRHWDEAALKQHEEMGFHAGWGLVADQLVALCEEATASA